MTKCLPKLEPTKIVDCRETDILVYEQLKLF